MASLGISIWLFASVINCNFQISCKSKSSTNYLVIQCRQTIWTLYFAFKYFVLCNSYLYFCISCSAVDFVIGIIGRNQVLFELFIRLQKVCMVTITDEPTNSHHLLIFQNRYCYLVGRYLIQQILHRYYCFCHLSYWLSLSLAPSRALEVVVAEIYPIALIIKA